MLNQKRLTLFLILQLTFSLSLFAEGDVSPNGARAIGGPVEAAEENSENAILSQMLEHPKVKPIAERCNQDLGNFDNYGECIWAQLSVDERNELAEAIKSAQAQERDSNRENPVEYDALDLGVNDVKLTPEMQKMQEHMSAKMNKALYGEGEKDKIAGQGTFYKLYKSSLGKNLIQAISGYCMGTNYSLASSQKRFLYEKNELEANYESWENALKTANGQNGESVQAVTLWNLCLTHIQFVCLDARPPKISAQGGLEKPDFVNSGSNERSYVTQSDIDAPGSSYTQDDLGKDKKSADGSNYCLKDNVTNSPPESDDYAKAGTKSCKGRPFENAQAQACVVYRAMKDTKYAMKTIDKITERFGEIAAGGANGVFESDAEMYESKGENSLNAMSTFTSSELLDESGVADIHASDKEKFYEECFNKDSETVVNSEACNEYLDTNRDEKQAEVAEFLLRKRAMEQKMATDFEDPEKLKKAILELGYDESKAQELMQIGGNSNFIKTQLKRRMAAETDALHRQLVDKMNLTTSKEDGTITTDNDKSKLKDIGESLSNKTKRMKQLIRFNNIVSGFLEVENGETGERGNNLLALEQELGVIDSEGDEGSAEISRVVSETGIREGGTSDSDNATLDAGTIDSELIYLQGGGSE